MLKMIPRKSGLIALLIACLPLTARAVDDKLTEHEQLYLKMLLEQRDGRAGVLQHCIQDCEGVLKRRKQRTAASRAAEPTRVSLGNGRYYDLDNTTSRKEIESLIKSLKDELELVETGATIPNDRYWDPQYHNTLGLLAGDIHVLQVIGPSDMLISGKASGIAPSWVAWIEGYSTRDLADDQPVKLGGVFVSDGTKSYTNTVGVKSTVRVLRPLIVRRDKVIAEFRAESKAGVMPASQAQSVSVKPNADTSPVGSDATPKSPRTGSNELTEDEQHYLNAILKARDARVDQLRRAIGQTQPATTASSKKTHGTRATKSGRGKPQDQDYVHVGDEGSSSLVTPLKSVQAELADLEVGKKVIEPGLVQPSEWRAGAVMSFRRWGGLKVLQVVGPSDMLVTTDVRESDSPWNQTIWLHGFPTKDVADGQRLFLQEPIVSDGTKRYDTVTGAARTVFVWRPLVIDREKVLAEYRAQSKPIPETAARAKPVLKQKPVEPTPADPDTAARKRFSGVLSNSRALIKAGLREAAESNLKRIIKEAPGTTIAGDAQHELDKLEGR
ncbi:MAG TPA: hypothetical protein VEI07_05565 [Planctomycetaceae bacterium]|nr:hypothetical protein [Planctomycetaceae bacterium]